SFSVRRCFSFSDNSRTFAPLKKGGEPKRSASSRQNQSVTDENPPGRERKGGGLLTFGKLVSAV
ncbi:MAG: hypothetical protein WBA17_18180, partial [Saprospiraceae bacterium]